MKTKLLTILILSLTIISCKKNSGTREQAVASLGKIQFTSKSLVASDSVIIKMDDKQNLPGVIAAVYGTGQDHFVSEGTHKFSIFSAENPGSLLLEQNITIQRNTVRKITLFRISNTDSLSIVNINTDTVSAPANEHVKISLANFATHLPSNIDVLFIQQVSNSPRKIDTIARFENVKKDFSPYQEIRLRKNQASQLIYALGFVIYNRDTKSYMTQMPSASGTLLNANTPKIRAFYLSTSSNGTSGQVKVF